MPRRVPAYLAVLTAVAALVAPATTPPALANASHRVGPIDGPDVASYQHPYGAKINWHRVARNHEFAIVKATEGTSYRNPWFWRDYLGARQAGLVRGTYHFARPAYPIVTTARHQARFFVRHIGDTKTRNTLPPALDLESTGGLSRGALVAWAQTFLLTVRKLTGRTPLIYTYPSFWASAIGDPPALARYPLWMAAYRGTEPDPTTTIWQYTSGARVDGIHTRVDMSRFLGPVDVWDSLRDGTVPSPWPAAAPGAPTHIGVQSGDSQLAVSWLPGDTGSTAVQRYRVTVTPADGTPATSVVVGGLTLAATVPGLVNGLPYTVTVAASNTHGYGVDSDPSDPVTPLVPTALTVGGATETVYGAGARVAVRLTRPDRGHGLPGRQVAVEQRIFDGSGTGWQPYRTVTTDRHGWVVLRLRNPQHNEDLRFTYTAPTGWRDAQRVVHVLVHNRITARLSRHKVHAHHSVALHGRIGPAVGGIRVYRQTFYRGAWHTFGASTRTGPHGAYAFRITPSWRGKHYYRTVVVGFDGRSHGTSRTLVVYAKR